MRRMLFTAAGLALAPWLLSLPGGELQGAKQGTERGAKVKPVKPAPKPQPADEEESTCHGTALQFVATPSEAAQQAKKEEKLVFVLHVSGHFEDPTLT